MVERSHPQALARPRKGDSDQIRHGSEALVYTVGVRETQNGNPGLAMRGVCLVPAAENIRQGDLSMSLRNRVGAVLLAGLLAVTGLNAQSQRSSVTGRILDSSGATVAGAKIDITNDATNVKFETVSNEVGYYQFLLLPYGSYTLRVNAAGFRQYTLTGISLVTATTANLDITLTVQSQAEEVTVQAAAPFWRRAPHRLEWRWSRRSRTKFLCWSRAANAIRSGCSKPTRPSPSSLCTADTARSAAAGLPRTRSCWTDRRPTPPPST
ncbi:MAG: carboxypeptidase regulatory-like domain-containing protein [Acidobacteria bacterium]|nr:carboxypeptidase regulatory-like domain-containing protein [Acidobacteriota bacterium]